MNQITCVIIGNLSSINNAIFLLTGTIGISNNGNIWTDERNERKYLEKKYNEL